MIAMIDDDDLLFIDEIEFADEIAQASPVDNPQTLEPWKILIVDDEVEIHNITRLSLGDFTYDNKKLEFLSAYSGKEARQVMIDNPDVAVILLDVIMESDDAGLITAKYIRETLQNRAVRIILRTGQPGQEEPSNCRMKLIDEKKQKIFFMVF